MYMTGQEHLKTWGVRCGLGSFILGYGPEIAHVKQVIPTPFVHTGYISSVF